MLRDSLEIRREVFGTEHPSTASLATSLGYWLIEARAFEEAEVLLQESLETRRKLLGAEHPQTAGTLTVIASLLIETGRFEEALAAARDARSALRQSVSEDSWRVAAAMNYEGQALAGIGDFESAEPLLVASQPGLENAPIPALAEKGRASLAAFYKAWENARQVQAARN